MTPTQPEVLSRQFHDLYEQLAPSFGYETRPETRQFDPDSPNGKLMTAVCAALLSQPSQGGLSLAATAQAVIDRWHSPKWEWHKQGPTADLIADLEKALHLLNDPAAPSTHIKE